MVDIFIKYLDKYLFTIEGDTDLRLRTLDELKNKVIVKSSSFLSSILALRRKITISENENVKLDLKPMPR